MNRCPYEVLGVERGADESTVRRRYLELVRSFPPQQLFEDGSGESIDVIVAELRDGVRRRPIPTELLLSLGELR
jgi:curved DNA-binding protein CbpA